MPPPQSTFELQVYLADHWVTERHFETEAEAKTCGRRLLGEGRADGIRVIRETRHVTGTITESRSFTEFRVPTKASPIAPIDEAAPCATLDDLYSFKGRLTLGRLFRPHIDRTMATPTEILHNHTEMRRLLNDEAQMSMALTRVAGLQASRTDSSPSQRREVLAHLMDTAVERVRRVARRDLPPLETDGFGALHRRVVAAVGPKEADFHALVVLTRDMISLPGWMAKLNYLLELLACDEAIAPEPLALLDGVIADVVGAPTVAADMLGPQRNLAAALRSLTDFSQGRFVIPRRSIDDLAVVLNRRLASGRLPLTAAMLLDLVRRQLRGTQPLHRHDPGAEPDVFVQVLARLAGPDGVVGGAPMAEALVMRYGRFIEAGGVPGRRQAIAGIAACIENPRARIYYLLALAATDLGRDHGPDIVGHLDAALGDSTLTGRLLSPGQPVKADLEHLTRLFEAVLAAPLADADRCRLADGLDRRLAAYIVEDQVIERLDNPGDLLRYRTVHLLQLCQPGVLRSPRALAAARDRVVAHLRQPDFDTLYVEDVPDPRLREKLLRDLHALLTSIGLR